MAWGWLAAAAAGAVLNRLLMPGQQQTPYFGGPAMVPPDFGPMWMLSDYTDWQHGTRNDLLREFFGAVPTTVDISGYTEPIYALSQGIGSMPVEPKWDPDKGWYYKGKYYKGSPIGTPPIWKTYLRDLDIWKKANADLNKTDFPPPDQDIGPGNEFLRLVGNKPENEYRAMHSNLVGADDNRFEGELREYLAQRGIKGGEATVATRGASQEQKRDYAQIMREVESRAKDIRMQTLGQLFGEVSDAGPATAQMAAAMQQGTEAWNQAASQRYNAALQQWQWNQQNQPMSDRAWLAQFAGQVAPYALNQMFTPAAPATPQYSPYGPYASGYRY